MCVSRDEEKPWYQEAIPVEPEEEWTACDALVTLLHPLLVCCRVFVDGYCKGTLIERVPDQTHKKRSVTSWLLKALCSAAEPSQHQAVRVASSLSLKDILEQHMALPLLTKHRGVWQPDSVPSVVPTGLVTFLNLPCSKSLPSVAGF